MIIKITEGISVSVETFYQPSYSRPVESEYFFAYRITIENFSDDTVQLLYRTWKISDSNGMVREVKGEGVVGQQPVIEPMRNHQYVSGCHLRTEMGMMRGSYLV